MNIGAYYVTAYANKNIKMYRVNLFIKNALYKIQSDSHITQVNANLHTHM